MRENRRAPKLYPSCQTAIYLPAGGQQTGSLPGKGAAGFPFPADHAAPLDPGGADRGPLCGLPATAFTGHGRGIAGCSHRLSTGPEYRRGPHPG